MKLKTWFKMSIGGLLGMVAIFFLLLAPGLHADAVTKAVPAKAAAVVAKVPAAVAVPFPKWFEGNWLLVNSYGDPHNALGWQAYQEITKQKADYAAAKKSGDAAEIAKYSFWSSVQAWGYNNTGHALILKGDATGSQSAEAKVSYKEAKTALLTAGNILATASDLSNGEPSQTAAFAEEEKNRSKVAVKIQSNLLYVKRVLGEIPWPKKKPAAPLNADNADTD